MIVDWFANGERILESGKLTEGDAWSSCRKWLQEVNFVRYLRSVGRDDAECRERLRALSNGTYALFSYTLGVDPRIAEDKVDGIMSAADAAGPLTPLPTVAVTAGEVGYVTSLSAPSDVKRYWMCLLVYVKTKRAALERATYDKAMDRYLLDAAGIPGRAADAKARIGSWSRACGIPFPLSVSATGSFYPVPRWAGVGAKVAECSLGDPSPAMALVGDAGFVCPSCGRRFERSPRAKTPLCGVCRERKKREDARMRKRKQRKKSD